MSSSAELQMKWDAFLKLLQVREPKFFEHLRVARPKELSKYNLVLLAKNADELREIDVGLRVYQDKLEEFTGMIFGSPRGVKAELASGEDWDAVAPATPAAPAANAAPAAPVAPAAPTAPAAPKEGKIPAVAGLAQDQNELLKILESSIRKKVEEELRTSIQQEMQSEAHQKQLLQRAKEDLEMEEQNRRLAVRMTLVAEGDRALSQLVMAWQQAKQTGDGGPPWTEVKQRLLELLDSTVQLIHS